VTRYLAIAGLPCDEVRAFDKPITQRPILPVK
jgi:hypothetical protein